MKISIIFLIVLLSFFKQVFANELHIIKNNGFGSHEVYQCVDTRECYDLYKTKRFFDSSINCATKMWIQRDNKIIMRLKGHK